MLKTSSTVKVVTLCAMWCSTVLLGGGNVVPTRQQDSFYFDPAPVSQTVIEGSEVRMRCDVSNRDKIIFSWWLNNKLVANTSRRFQEGTDLRITAVDRTADSGGFRCVATNVSTSIALRSAEARLTIQWIAKTAEVKLAQPSNAEDLVDGAEVIMECLAQGNPDPTVEWFRNKARIQSGGRFKFVRNRLSITSANAVADNGVYSCRARNTAGTLDSIENLVLIISGAGLPELDTSQFVVTKVIQRGGQATMNCLFKDASRVEWYFDQQLVTNTRHRYMLHSNGSLSVVNVSSRDVGVYRCVGFSTSDPRINQTFTSELILAYLDEMTDASFEPRSSQLQVVPASGKYRVKCTAPKGLPEPTITWTGPNDVALTSVDQQATVRVLNNSLIIQNAVELDAGNYTCRAENMAGTRSRTISVVISVVPQLSLPPLSTRVTEGATATFECRVTATPYPVTVISWTYDEVPLDITDERYSVDAAAGKLTISNCQLKDEGNYACVVLTTGHPALVSPSARLYVEKQLKFRPVPVNTKLELGAVGRIACRADGRTAPTVRWVKATSSGDVYQPNSYVSLPDHVAQTEDGSLYFRAVESGDAGNYTCIASNDQGSISATIRVDIVVKPRITLKPVNTTVVEGGHMMLHCVAIGDPDPTVHWDKNNRADALDLRRFKTWKNGSLFLSEVFAEDAGKYGCTAGNTGGLVREEIYLTITGSRDSSGLEDSDDGTGGSAPVANVTNTIVIAVCSVVAYLAIVIGLTVYCSLRLVRRRNRRKRNSAAAAAAPTENGHHNTTAVAAGNKIENKFHSSACTEMTELMTRDTSIVKHDADSRSATSSNPSNQSNNSHKIYEKLSVSRNQLQTVGMLGKGQFGEVFVARAFNIDLSIPDCLVMVKSLLFVEEPNQAEFYREIELFRQCNHANIVRLMGLCRDVYPTFAIYEYCDWGSLKLFLQTVGVADSPHAASLSVGQRVSMCLQVARAMNHIATELRLVHGDLAARNLVVSSSLVVKISNPSVYYQASPPSNPSSLSSNGTVPVAPDVKPFASEYFVRPGGQRAIPLRWMAPELVIKRDLGIVNCADSSQDQHRLLQQQLTSMAGDVWAFGVVIWEMFAAGCPMPLADKSDLQVLSALEAMANSVSSPLKGSRRAGGGEQQWLRRPTSCPDHLWSVAIRCLDPLPARRPSFVDVVGELDEMKVKDDSFV